MIVKENVMVNFKDIKFETCAILSKQRSNRMQFVLNLFYVYLKRYLRYYLEMEVH